MEIATVKKCTFDGEVFNDQVMSAPTGEPPFVSLHYFNFPTA